MEAKQTHLIELLERIPQDAMLVVEHDQFSSSSHPVGRLCYEAITALRAALAEPEPEPVAWIDWWRDHGQHNLRATSQMTFERAKELMKLAFEVGREAAPPARRALTDDQIKAAVMDDPFFGAALMSMMRDNAMVSDVRQAIVGIFRAAERAHGITGGNDE